MRVLRLVIENLLLERLVANTAALALVVMRREEETSQPLSRGLEVQRVAPTEETTKGLFCRGGRVAELLHRSCGHKLRTGQRQLALRPSCSHLRRWGRREKTAAMRLLPRSRSGRFQSRACFRPSHSRSRGRCTCSKLLQCFAGDAVKFLRVL